MGIIRNPNVKYRQKPLKFAISRIGNNVKTIDIIQGVDILKAISWITSAWEDLDQGVINGFHKFDIRKECPDVQVLDQEEEFASLVKELLLDVFVSDSINFYIEVSTSQPLVDVKSIVWRKEYSLSKYNLYSYTL